MKPKRDELGTFRTPTGVAVDSVGLTEGRASVPLFPKPKRVNWANASDEELLAEIERRHKAS